MTISVCIVEDDLQTRKILAGWIGTAPGFELVGDWGSAENALARLPEARPDVVLMDINLQAASGIELVKRLKVQLPATQFVMVTVYQDADHIYDALAAGATGYLLKEASREELIAAVEDVHQGGSPMSSRIARKVVQSFTHSPVGIPAGAGLSAREEEVLGLLARGYLIKEVADQLKISIPTVKTYVRRMYEKLHVRSRSQAVAKYARLDESKTNPA